MESLLPDDLEQGVFEMFMPNIVQSVERRQQAHHNRAADKRQQEPGIHLSGAGIFVMVMMVFFLIQFLKFLYWPSQRFFDRRKTKLGIVERLFMSRWQLLTIFFAISGLATTQMAVQGGLLSLPEEVMEEEWFITIIRPPVVSAFFSICGVNTLVSIQALLCCSGFVKWRYAHWFNDSRYVLRTTKVGASKLSWTPLEKLIVLAIQWYIFLASYLSLVLSLLPLFASIIVLLATDVPWNIYTNQLYPRLSKGIVGSLLTSRIENYIQQHEVLETAATFQTTVLPLAIWSVLCQVNVLLYSWSAYLRVTDQLEGNDTLLGLLEEYYGVGTWWQLGDPIKKSASVAALHRVLSHRILVPISKSVSEMNLFRLTTAPLHMPLSTTSLHATSTNISSMRGPSRGLPPSSLSPLREGFAGGTSISGSSSSISSSSSSRSASGNARKYHRGASGGGGGSSRAARMNETL